MGVPVSLGWLGIGRELYAGTPVLPAATVPVLTGSWDVADTPAFLDDMGIRAVMSSPAGMTPGTQQGTFSFGGPFFTGPAGFFLDNLFGDLSTVSGGTLGAAQPLAAPLNAGATSLAVTTSLGTVTTGSVIQISDGDASETVTATAYSTGTAVNFAQTPCRFPHATTATAALETALGGYAHTFAALNGGTGQPPVHTLTDVTGLTPGTLGRCYPMAALTSLTLTGDPAGWVTVKYAGSSWLSAPAPATPSPSTAFSLPLTGWQTTVTIAGTPVTAAGPWEVTLTRDLVAYWQPNSLLPTFARGDLKAAATLGYVLPTDETALGNMLTAGPQQVLITASNGLTGTPARSLAIQMSAAQCTAATPDRGASQVRYATAWGANANAGDSGGTAGTSAAQVTLVNAAFSAY